MSSRYLLVALYQKERIEELRVDDTSEEIVVVEEVKEKKREDEKNVEEIIHCYVPMSSYVCTLPHECFEKIEKDFVADMEGVREHNDETLHLATASKLVLTSEKRKKQKKQPISNDSVCWIQYGGNILNKKHLQQVVQGKELCDLHVNAFQSLLKCFFPHIGGLMCTLYQDKKLLHLIPGAPAIQILHTRNSHWATLYLEDGSICLFDSSFTSIMPGTLETIGKLINCKEK